MKKRMCIYIFIFMIGMISCGGQGKEYVNFYNYNGDLLWQIPYKKNMVLVYEGVNPERKDDDMYTYTFSSWNHDLSEVDTYRNFYALYDKDYRTFDVSFYSYDNKLISTISAKYGSNILDKTPMPPNRENEDRIHYYFNGWGDVDLSYITEDLNCYAQYTSIECYKITFKDVDDSLIHIEYVEKGKDSNYIIERTKEIDDEHYSIFSKWSKSVENVLCDMTVYAEYKVVKACTVTFKNYDGTILGTDKGPEGFNAKYTGTTPKKSSTTSGNYIYNYTFNGWDKTLENVTTSFSTTAQYKSTSTYYNKEYESALETIRQKARATSYDSELGRYYKGFEVYLTSTYSITGYAETNAETDVVDLYYSTLSVSGGNTGGGAIEIFFDLHKPGTYYCTYKYVYNGSTVAAGMFNISSSWSNSSKVTFTDLTNISTSSNSLHVNFASELVSSCLSEAKGTSWIDTYALGFYNY